MQKYKICQVIEEFSKLAGYKNKAKIQYWIKLVTQEIEYPGGPNEGQTLLDEEDRIFPVIGNPLHAGNCINAPVFVYLVMSVMVMAYNSHIRQMEEEALNGQEKMMLEEYRRRRKEYIKIQEALYMALPNDDKLALNDVMTMDEMQLMNVWNG
jgi:hypothetical protein